MAFVSNPLNFANLTAKGAPVGADLLLLADSAAAGAIKQTLISSLPFAPLAGAAIVNVTAATQAMAIDTIYYVNYNAGVCTLTIPTAASSTQGAFIGIIGGEDASDPFVLAQAANQQIRMVDQLTTAGVGGTLTADNIFCSCFLRCNSLAGGLVWNVVYAMGSFAGV